jgi:hypothetical protein
MRAMEIRRKNKTSGYISVKKVLARGLGERES